MQSLYIIVYHCCIHAVLKRMLGSLCSSSACCVAFAIAFSTRAAVTKFIKPIETTTRIGRKKTTRKGLASIRGK